MLTKDVLEKAPVVPGLLWCTPCCGTALDLNAKHFDSRDDMRNLIQHGDKWKPSDNGEIQSVHTHESE